MNLAICIEPRVRRALSKHSRHRIRFVVEGNREPEFHHLLIHEAGVGRSHFLKENCGHIHLAIGFKRSSRFYDDPAAHMAEFMVRVKGGTGPDSGRKWDWFPSVVRLLFLLR